MAIGWSSSSTLDPLDFRCGHCGREVSSDRGYFANHSSFRVYVCPRCWKASFTDGNTVVPGAPFGSEVAALPSGVEALYREARQAVQASSYTAAVLTCRKILMHVAVDQGAPTGRGFFQYVDFLATQGYVPPNGRKWVDHIRKRGNEANHEIVVMQQQDAAELVIFTEMLLKFIYELPSLVPDLVSDGTE